MLLTRISIPPPPELEPEDIFHSALTTIFTDDAVNSHGTPGSFVTYRSPRFGDISLRIPAHPDVDDGRKLFAHYLWNAAVVAADAIESASNLPAKPQKGIQRMTESTRVQWAGKYFGVRDKRILELGAGTALPSIISALVGASSCTITDHPSSPALTMGAIEQNVQANIHTLPKGPPTAPSSPSDMSTAAFKETDPHHHPEEQHSSLTSHGTNTQILVWGYTWGTLTFYLPSAYGKPVPKPSSPEFFDRIVIADCLWMPSQHINLIRTILTFLPPSSITHQTPAAEGAASDDQPCALVTAGFHTGRRIVSDFFALATQPILPAEPEMPAASSSLHIPPHDTSAPVSTNVKDDATLPSDLAGSKPVSLSPEASTVNTVPLNTQSLSPADRAVCGLLHLASIFEVDVDGNTRPWQSEREGEGRWEAKRWCVVGVLVRK